MSFKNQSVFSSTYTNTTFTVTEGMGISSITINLVSGSANLLGGLGIPSLTNSSVALTAGQPVVLNVSSGYTLEGVTVDSTAGGVFQVFTIYDYINSPDPSATAFLAATGITGAVQSAAIDTLVKSLKAYNLWPYMKAVYPFVTDQYNLLSYTNALQNPTYWTSFNSTTVASSVITPDNDTTGYVYTTTVDTNNKIWTLFPTSSVASTTYTASYYVKYNNQRWGFIQIWEGSGQTGATAWIDLQNGILGTTSATADYTIVSTLITSETNGWYRVSITATCLVSNKNLYTVFQHDSGNGTFNYTGLVGKATYIWHPQFEISTSPTAYQQQTGSAQSVITSQFKYNLVNPVDSDAAYRLVFNGGWTMSNFGATPNGINGYADTKLVPSSVLSSINNVHLSHYSRTQNSAISAHDIGVDVGGDAFNLSQYFASVNFKLFMNGQFPINSAEFNQTNTLGLSVGSATSSTLRKLYFNGTLLNTDTNTQNTTLPSVAIYLGSGRNGATAPYVAAYFSNRQTAFATVGNGLTDAQAANFYTIVQAYQTALSRQV